MAGTSTKYKQTIKGSKDAAESWKRQAEMLAQQAAATANRRPGLDAQFANAQARNKASRREIVKDLLGGFRTSQAGYDRSESDATDSLGITAASSRLNRAREGTSAMAELSNMQAGETDRIKGMAASIRNMKANLDGGASDYASAITNINNSLGDLNTSTQTNVNNALREQGTNDAQAFAEWSAGYQQTYADLVDLYGQQGAAYEQMGETLADKISESKQSGTSSVKSSQTDTFKHNKASKAAVEQAKGAFGSSVWAANQLTAQMAKSYSAPTLNIDTMNAEETDPDRRFAAAAMKANQANLDELANAGALRKLAGPEGSKLRRKDDADV